MRLHRWLIFAVLVAAIPAPASASVVRGQALSPDGQDLYVIAQDGEEDGALLHYKVGAGGTPAYVGCYGLPAGCGPSGFDEFDWPRDIEVSADGRDVYVLNPGLAQYRRGADGRLTYVGTTTGGRIGESRVFAISPDGRNAYVAAGVRNPFRESRIVQFRRDTTTGATAYVGCVGADFLVGAECVALPAGVVSTSGPNGIVVSSDSRHVYTTGATGSSNDFEGPTAVTHFRAGPDGALTFADCIGNESSGCPGLPADTAQHQARMGPLAFEAGGLSVSHAGPYADTVARLRLGAGGELAFAGCHGHTSAPGCAFGSAGPRTGTPASIELEAPEEATQMTGGLNARINTYGARYAVRWEYGPTTAYGRFDEGGSESSAGGGWTRIEASLRDLAPGTTYHYRLVVNTPAGPVYSPDATFTTKPYTGGAGLIVETHQPLGTTGTAAAFAATVQGTGRYWFEWGETQELGRTTPPREIPATDWSPRSVKELVTGLEPGKRYHYRVVGENVFGRVVARSGAAVQTYTGPATPGPEPTPEPTPDPSPSPDASPGTGTSPDPVTPPAADATPVLGAFPPAAGPGATPTGRGTTPPARPRVSVTKRRIVVTLSARTRVTIHRRAGKRWVRVVTVTTSRTVRRTVKPGLYRVTAGTVKRQVRVR